MLRLQQTILHFVSGLKENWYFTPLRAIPRVCHKGFYYVTAMGGIAESWKL